MNQQLMDEFERRFESYVRDMQNFRQGSQEAIGRVRTFARHAWRLRQLFNEAMEKNPSVPAPPPATPPPAAKGPTAIPQDTKASNGRKKRPPREQRKII